MDSEWQYQIRFDISDPASADLLRRKVGDPALAPLVDVLRAHGAEPICQFDAFADYVATAEAQGADGFPLYAWTRAVIADPVKKAKYLKSFTLHVGAREVYARQIADALEAALRPLAASGLIARLSKYDTNPANNPQPPS